MGCKNNNKITHRNQGKQKNDEGGQQQYKQKSHKTLKKKTQRARV